MALPLLVLLLSVAVCSEWSQEERGPEIRRGDRRTQPGSSYKN